MADKDERKTDHVRVLRTFAASDIEVRTVKRQTDDGEIEERRVSGYALKWNDQYDTPWWSERFAKGAFEDSIKERKVVVLNGHDRKDVIGSTNSGTTVSEDNTGLKFDAPLNRTTIADDVIEMIRNEDVEGVSVGGRLVSWETKGGEGRDGNDLYINTEFELHEFSFTAFPAFEQTEAEVRCNELLNERRSRPDSSASNDKQPNGFAGDRERSFKYAQAVEAERARNIT